MQFVNFPLLKQPLNYFIVGLSIIFVFASWSLIARWAGISAPMPDGSFRAPEEETA